MEKRLLQSHSIFPTQDILRTTEYYEKVLEFNAVKYIEVSEPHICLYRDDTEIILTVSKNKGLYLIVNYMDMMHILLQRNKINFNKNFWMQEQILFVYCLTLIITIKNLLWKILMVDGLHLALKKSDIPHYFIYILK
ncbi:hypothetical protein [Clostridium sp.]